MQEPPEVTDEVYAENETPGFKWFFYRYETKAKPEDKTEQWDSVEDVPLVGVEVVEVVDETGVVDVHGSDTGNELEVDIVHFLPQNILRKRLATTLPNCLVCPMQFLNGETIHIFPPSTPSGICFDG